jgi:vacuolar-type H+-ATPase subunit E/Vma4
MRQTVTESETLMTVAMRQIAAESAAESEARMAIAMRQIAAESAAESEARLAVAMQQADAASEQRVLDEMGRHVKAVGEMLAAHVSAVDEPYRDLPPRVRRLEAKVFPARRR